MKKIICGIPLELTNVPEADEDFTPFSEYIEAFLKTAKKPFAIATEREGGQVQVFETFIHGTDEMYEADLLYAERLTKFFVYARGAFRIDICGDERIGNALKQIYAPGGAREFDYNFMVSTYDRPLEIAVMSYDEKPTPVQNSVSIGRHSDGCRIGFDMGGSDRKVSAVIDGEPVFSEETVWFPKLQSDPQYHIEGVRDSLSKAAAHMPRVDAIGISSAGVYIENKAKVTSLFMSLSPEDKVKHQSLFVDTAREMFPGVPVCVVNDGDVTALAGAMSLEKNAVFGIAMGTSEAAGYVDRNGSITGWLNELAFAPIDLSPKALRDEWSGDIGCGVKYLCQDGLIKLCPAVGIPLDESLSPAEKLVVIQKLMEADDPRAVKIYETIGIYLAYALRLYSFFYDIEEVLLLGRAVSGKGGQVMLDKTLEIMRREWPEMRMNLSLPSEKTRRVGQSVAAAGLPEL